MTDKDELTERLRANSRLNLCPFDRRWGGNVPEPDEPCPICGGLGTPDAEDRCMGANTRLFNEAADEIDRLEALVAKKDEALRRLALNKGFVEVRMATDEERARMEYAEEALALTLDDMADMIVVRKEPIAYLRDLDGTGSLHACAKGDPGAIAVYGDVPD